MKIKILLLFFICFVSLSVSAHTISYTLTKPGPVSLAIYNPAGMLVRTVYSAKPQPVGRQTYEWDGLDDDGQPVPDALACTWKLLQLPAPLRADYLLTLLVTLPPGDEWWETGVGNHSGVRALAVDATGIYLGAGISENVCNAMKMNLEGTKRLWSAWQPDPFKGRWAYGISKGNLYHLQQDGYVGYHPVDAPNRLFQALGVGKNQTGRRWDAQWPGTKRAGANTWRPAKAQGMDMAVHNGVMVLSYRDQNAVQFRQPEDGTVLATVEVDAPLGVAIDNNGDALVISNNAVLRVTRNGKSEPFLSDLDNPWRLDVDRKNGDVYLAETVPSHRVKRFSAAGKLVWETGREGGREYGVYQPQHFKDITDIAATGNGFVVAEEAAPRRVARFDQAGKFVKEWHTGTQWVPSGAPDPDDPTTVWARVDSYDLLKLKLDLAARTYRIERIYQLNGLAGKMIGTRFEGNAEGLGGGFGDWVVRKKNGNTYLARREMIQVIRVDAKTNTLKPVAVAEFKKETSSLWTDGNGDGEPQPDEVRKFTWGESGILGNAAAGTADDLDYYRYNRYANKVYRVPVQKFNAVGAPVYASPPDKVTAVPQFTGFDNKRIYLEKSTGVLARTDDRLFVAINTQPPKADWNVADYAQLHIFDAEGNYVARVGQHVNRPKGPFQHAPRPQPGEVYCFKNLVGAVYDVAVATDFDGGFSGRISAITYAWDKNGLFVGGLFDKPNTKLAPLHGYYHSGDNGSGTILPDKATGEALYYAGRENELAVYRVSGWKGWVRLSGKVK
jgi:hypothetical protein